MPVPFAAVVTPDSLIFTAPDGKTHSIAAADPVFDTAKRLVREIGALRAAPALIEDDDPAAAEQDRSERIAALVALVSPAAAINARGEGRVTVRDGVVYYDGAALHSVVTDRILWGLSEGFNMQPYLAFLDRLMQNPSKRAVDALLSFIEHARMGITDDGYVLAYKRVRADFKDIYTATIDNAPGQIVSMPRNWVNDDPSMTCSQGLHVCAQRYLPQYRADANNDTIVIVKVDPADFVSVPTDYGHSKARVCRYEVLSEYQVADRIDLLATTAVWTTQDLRLRPLANETDDDDEPDEDDDEPDDDEPDDDESDDDESDDEPDDHDGGIQYDRGYDTGYAEGLCDAVNVVDAVNVADATTRLLSSAVHRNGDDAFGLDFASGFADGWRAGMSEGRSVGADGVEPAASDPDAGDPDAGLAAADNGKVLPAALPSVAADTNPDQTVAHSIPATDQDASGLAETPSGETPSGESPSGESLVERDVILARAEPVQVTPDPTAKLQFDPVTGLFFLRPSA